ncbi:MAG: hypothetical protein KKG59_02295 [Nanoarchaeota archaeon]|nr:hypothetical protein [Nanoarchaeota archaeon]
MKIYVFGNEFLEEDNLAIKLAKSLPYDFVFCDDPYEILDLKEVVIMDVVQGLKKVEIIDDISRLDSNKMYSLHDFDLSYILQLQKSLGKLGKVKIIGVPQDGTVESLLEELRHVIESLKQQTI